MFENCREFVDLLCTLGISPNQFLICWLIYEKNVPATLKYYEENKRNKISHADIDWLLNNGFLLRIDKSKNGVYDTDEFLTTTKFSEAFLVDDYDAGEEFWTAYPSWLFFDNSRKTAKAVDKDELIEDYLKKINNSRKTHLKVMEVVKKYASENKGYAAMNIKNFVGSKHWEQLEELYRDTSSGDLIKNL